MNTLSLAPSINGMHPNHISCTIEPKTTQLIIQQPEELINVLSQVSQQSHAIADILEELMKRSDIQDVDRMRQQVCESFLSFSPNIKILLLNEHPLFFVHLIKYLNIEQRKRVLKEISRQLPEWKELFMQICQNVDVAQQEKEFCNHLKEYFISQLMDALSPHRKKQLIKYFSLSMEYQSWALFVLMLKGKDRSLALNTATQTYNFDLSPSGYLPCFDAFAELMYLYPTDIKSILNTLLQQFYREKKFNVLVDEFGDLKIYIQICLLNAMTLNKRDLVLKRHCTDTCAMAVWLDGLLRCQRNFNERKYTVQRICQALQEGTLSDFVDMLNFHQSKVGAYLLTCLPIDLFQEFAFTLPLASRTKLLSNGVVDAFSSELLDSLYTDKERSGIIYELMGLEMQNRVVPVDPTSPYTLLQCYQLFQDIGSDIAADYSSFIICIPPILIGLLAKMKHKQAALIKVAPYMSEEQLKFLVCSFNNLQCRELAEKHGSSLGFGRFTVLLQGLSSSKLIDYVKFKTEKLESIHANFNEQYHILQSSYEEMKQEFVLMENRVEEWHRQAINLHTMARTSSSMHYHHLWKFIQDERNSSTFSLEEKRDLEMTISKCRVMADHLNSKRQLFEGAHAIIPMQLQELQNMIFNEEKDFTIELYEGFWTLVREETLPYLGISPHSPLGIIHTGQLSLVGIRSNQDLEILGISAQLQNQVEKLIDEFEKLKPMEMPPLMEEHRGLARKPSKTQINQLDQSVPPGFSALPANRKEAEALNNSHMIIEQAAQNKKKPSIIWTLWQDCVSIKLTETEAQPICEQMVKALNLSCVKIEKLKEGCQNLCTQLLECKYLLDKDRISISKILDTFVNNHKPGKVMTLGEKLLLKALLVLRTQHPLFCLQRYLLDNQHLKQGWEKLHVKGYSSLQDLVKDQKIQSYADCLKIGEIAKHSSKRW